MDHVLPTRVGIIGAGLTGLACGERIARAGIPVVLLDKSRDIGGRLATRRRDGGRWNHGAPAVHALDPEFRARLGQLVGAGHARELAGGESGGAMVVAGLPDMRELLRPIAAGLTVELGAEAERLQRGAVGWTIRTRDGGAHGLFDIVVCTQPVPQACRLLTDSGIDFPPALAGVAYAPAWVLLLTLADAAADLGALAGGESFTSATRNRPAGADGDTDAPAHWVLHANAAWSAAHLELPQEDALGLLRSALEREFAQAGAGIGAGTILAATAHRWRFARATRPLGRACLWLPAARIAIGGDGCAGGDADGAFRSAIALADTVIAAARRDA